MIARAKSLSLGAALFTCGFAQQVVAPTAPQPGPVPLSPQAQPQPSSVVVRPEMKEPARPEPQAAPRVPRAFPVQKDRGEVKTLNRRNDDDIVVVREMRDIKEINFNPDAVPVIDCLPHIVTSIFLPEGEQVTGATIGDESHWKLTPYIGTNVIFLKPTQVGRHYETNLVVITKKGNVYNVGLTADPDARPIKTLRILAPGTGEDDNSGVFHVGQDSPNGPMRSGRRISEEDVAAIEARIRAENKEAEEERQRQFVQAMLNQRNDDYKVSYSWRCPFRVTNIFDASGVTWIRIETPDGAQPVIFSIDESGHRANVNFQPSNVDPHILMVDRRLRNAVIVVGKKEARIRNLGLEREIARLGKK